MCTLCDSYNVHSKLYLLFGVYMKDELKFLSVRIPEPIHKKLRIKAIDEGLTLQELILMMIKEKVSLNE